MAEKKRKTKQVASGKARIARVNITQNVYSYEDTTKVKEKENKNNADITD